MIIRPVLLFFLVLLFACEPPVTFKEPQPAGAAALKEFPGKLWGTYRSLKDNATLEISSRYIIRTYNEKLYLPKTELDSGFVLKGNILTETGETYKAKISGDSIVAFFHASDTVFALSPEYVLTKQKGQYFLNTRYDPGKYGVQKMALHKNLLAIHSVVLSADLTKLRSISAVETDSPQNFKPTRKQFREFIKMDGFGSEELFLKI